MESIRDVRKTYQVDVIFKFVSGKDTFISMPTGSGKSICFSSTPIVFDKLTDVSLGVSTQHCIVIVVPPLTGPSIKVSVKRIETSVRWG